MFDRIQVDTHTHTVISGHAWSTLTENAKVAAEKGMDALCLTEHGHAMPGVGVEFIPASQIIIPRQVEGVTIYKGIEANIVDMDGRLDVKEKYLAKLEFAIASFHDICLEPSDSVKNTDALVAAINHPRIDVLGHLDDPRVPSDIKVLVLEAKRLGKLVELNNNSLAVRPGGDKTMLALAKLCQELGVKVCLSSDAHFSASIGVVEKIARILNDISFPTELVANLTLKSFETYLASRRQRLGAA